MGQDMSISPETDVNTNSGNSSSVNHSVKDSTNTEINLNVTTSFCFLVLCFLLLFLLIVYYLWSKNHHRTLNSRIETLAQLTGHHPQALEAIPLQEIITSKS